MNTCSCNQGLSNNLNDSTFSDTTKLLQTLIIGGLIGFGIYYFFIR